MSRLNLNGSPAPPPVRDQADQCRCRVTSRGRSTRSAARQPITQVRAAADPAWAKCSAAASGRLKTGFGLALAVDMSAGLLTGRAGRLCTWR